MCVWESLCGGIIGEIWALGGGLTGCREPQNTETWIVDSNTRGQFEVSIGVGT